MRILLIVVACLWYTNYSLAQAQKHYLVKAGEAPDEAIPNEAKYIMAAFTNGTAFLRSGAIVNQSFNFNYLLNEMQFLNAKGDTLAIADPAQINYINIDTLVFYYDKGWLREIFKTDSYKLAVKQQMLQTSGKVGGAYDAMTGSSAITTYGSIYSSEKVHRLQVKRDVVFTTVISCYIGDVYNHFVRADKKGFFNTFSSKRDATKDYLKKVNIDFNKEADLKKLLQFCITQQ